MQQHFLRQQNYQLKNQITDLKNAFDLNRDILKILNNYNTKNDPHFGLLMQIITRLTSVNNQAMLNNIELIHQKNVLKQENLKLNLEVNSYEERLREEIQVNGSGNQPNQSRMLMQEQFQALNKELMAANQERIVREQEIQFWKGKAKNRKEGGNRNVQNHNNYVNSKEIEQEFCPTSEKINRRYISNKEFKYQSLYNQLKKENKLLKTHIEQLQNRLLVFIKAYNLQQEAMNNGISDREREAPFFENEREEIRLLKYALNDIHIDKKQDECILTITQRFKQNNVNQDQVRTKRSFSWPKHLTFSQQERKDIEVHRKKMEEREDQYQRNRY